MRSFLVLPVVVATLAACSGATHQKDFSSADEAVQALVASAKANDSRSLLEVLGEAAQPAVESGDAVQDKNSREKFLHEYEAAHTLDKNPDGTITLDVGDDKWPFPFPIAEQNGRWRFDSTAGVEELVNRRVGGNELFAIQSCLAFVDAEREYYTRNPQNDSLQQYARKLISSDGKKDGLYWPSTGGSDTPSPLGEEFARARDEGYFQSNVPPASEPFHGYIYKLLTAQGPNAKGGAYDYLVHDKMMGGFALLAFPADYGNSGVMSFIVNHDGVVFSKDLGADTPKVAQTLDVFDPDSTWKREAEIDQKTAASN